MEPDPERAMPPLDRIKEVQEDDASVKYAGDSDADSRRSKTRPRMPNRRPTSASSAGSEIPIPILDPENPGPWLIYHHKKNLIRKLKKPRINVLTYMYEKIRNIGFQAYSELFGDGTKNAGATANQVDDDPDAENNWEKRRFRVSFAELQRMYLRKLQCKLVKDVVEMYDTDDEVAGWESNLKEYIKALQDYDYMNTCSERVADPFLATSENYIDMLVLYRTMDSVSENFHLTKFDEIGSLGKWKGDEDSAAIGGTRHNTLETSRLQNFYKRLGIAAFGGVFLLGPMWLMVLHRTHYTSLISTTVCVALFGLIMAIYLETVTDVLASTAAYAAVLVVFVGLNT
ncbi:hypothetical protein V8E51_013879 [Hyaloscypha variabilis]